jgi:hypothetical protein
MADGRWQMTAETEAERAGWCREIRRYEVSAVKTLDSFYTHKAFHG